MTVRDIIKYILKCCAGFNPDIDMSCKDQLVRSLKRRRRMPEIWIYYPPETEEE
jgi:hypothetical protein